MMMEMNDIFEENDDNDSYLFPFLEMIPFPIMQQNYLLPLQYVVNIPDFFYSYKRIFKLS